MSSRQRRIAALDQNTAQPGTVEMENQTQGTLMRKRAKYTLRACHYCQRRKIKCYGGDPCRPCRTREQPCHKSDRDADEAQPQAPAPAPASSSSSSKLTDGALSDPAIGFLLRRLVQLEERLGPVDPTNALQLQSPHASDSPTASVSNRVPESQRVMWDDSSPYAGEISVRYSLEQMEDRLNRLGVDHTDRPCSPPTQPLTPLRRPSTPEHPFLDSRALWQRTGNVRHLLDSYGLVFHLEEWRMHLATYLSKVHPLYPFLFSPSLRETFDRLWESYSTNTPIPVSAGEDMGLRLAIVFLCLATGRCTTANRKQNEAHHSAGWSLYCVANDMVGDVLHLCGNSGSPMLQLQTLCSMVVYLFRLDANERAQNVLALAISHAHSLGINRSSTLEKMPFFEEEMFRRLWWCIYVIDRRLCLETGRPFLVLDINIDVALPSDVDDSEMLKYQYSTERTDELDPAMLAGPNQEHSSLVTYLKVMVGYSRISGKVWEAVYSAPVAKQPLNNLIREYVETSLDQWRQSIPATLSWAEPQSDSFASNTEARQGFILYLRYNYMKLMIRKPALQQGRDNLDRNITCIGLADLIISGFIQWHENLKILEFPYIGYLLGATMASLSVLIYEPALQEGHAKLLLSAAELLKKSCYQSWVSGKTTRTIARVYSLIQSTLNSERASAHSATAFSANISHNQPMLPTATSQQTTPPATGIICDDVYEKTPTANPYASPGPSGPSQKPPPLMTPDQEEFGLLPDFTWPDLNMHEFDFEHSLQGSAMGQVNGSWDCKGDSWLDGLSFAPVTSQSHSQ